MILDKKVLIVITPSKLKFYKNLGYDVKNFDKITIPIKQLDKGSHLKINCKCDLCDNEKSMEYRVYLKNTKNETEPYYCNKCNNVKRTNTLLKEYGVSNNFQRIDVKQKIKNKVISNYNVDNPSKSDVIKNKKITTIHKKIIDKYQEIIGEDFIIISYDNIFFNIKHTICGNDFFIHRKTLYARLLNNLNCCLICYPLNDSKSIKEKELINWLKELNIDFIESDKTILNPKHLDIYIPSHNLGIEMNGLYHHSEIKKDKNYHLEKSLKCLEQGIQLLHIWEDEWVFKKDIVKSIILNKLNLISEKIYARQCEIRVIEDSKLVRDFLDTNHIQGYCQSSIKLGLFKDNELVSLMTFGKRMIKSNVEFELIRFCNKINLNVIGSASKLFNYFKSNYKFTELISYSDFRLFDGKMYEALGFTKKHLSKPDYFWCKGLERKHRFNFNKQKLIREGFDSNKTEVEIMHERGYFRVFGCGQYRWKYYK